MTFGVAPIVGNIMVAATNYSQYQLTRTISADQSGWTRIDDASNGNDSLATWWRLVQPGDTVGAWTWTITGTAEWSAAEMYEISSASTVTPINQHSIVAGSLATVATTAVTPSVLNCLGITATTSDGSVAEPFTVSSGWTIDEQSNAVNYHVGAVASLNALTADTTTAISVTWTKSVAEAGLAAILLIQPAGSTDMRVDWNIIEAQPAGHQVQWLRRTVTGDGYLLYTNMAGQATELYKISGGVQTGPLTVSPVTGTGTTTIAWGTTYNSAHAYLLSMRVWGAAPNNIRIVQTDVTAASDVCEFTFNETDANLIGPGNFGLALDNSSVGSHGNILLYNPAASPPTVAMAQRLGGLRYG